VLWATHLADEVRPEDQVVILHRGRVLAEDRARALCGERTVAEMFLTLVGEATG
jgi:ABC-2 type transport system ATP-binding protein